MHDYQVEAEHALDILKGALYEAEAILPAHIRARYKQEQHVKGVNEWSRVQSWYRIQLEWQRPVANILSDLVLLSDAKAKLVTVGQGEPVHEPNINLPKVRRTP
jgi:hypothetical protein